MLAVLYINQPAKNKYIPVIGAAIGRAAASAVAVGSGLIARRGAAVTVVTRLIYSIV
jgi:hypothetical protein